MEASMSEFKSLFEFTFYQFVQRKISKTEINQFSIILKAMFDEDLISDSEYRKYKKHVMSFNKLIKELSVIIPDAPITEVIAEVIAEVVAEPIAEVIAEVVAEPIAQVVEIIQEHKIEEVKPKISFRKKDGISLSKKVDEMEKERRQNKANNNNIIISKKVEEVKLCDDDSDSDNDLAKATPEAREAYFKHLKDTRIAASIPKPSIDYENYVLSSDSEVENDDDKSENEDDDEILASIKSHKITSKHKENDLVKKEVIPGSMYNEIKKENAKKEVKQKSFTKCMI